MQIGKEEISEIISLIENAEEFRPVVTACINAVSSYSGEIEKMLHAVSDFQVAIRLRSIQQYQDAGCSREEAILLTLDVAASVKTAMQNLNRSNKK